SEEIGLFILKIARPFVCVIEASAPHACCIKSAQACHVAGPGFICDLRKQLNISLSRIIDAKLYTIHLVCAAAYLSPNNSEGFPSSNTILDHSAYVCLYHCACAAGAKRLKELVNIVTKARSANKSFL